MERFLAPASRPSSAMSSVSDDERPAPPVILLDDDAVSSGGGNDSNTASGGGNDSNTANTNIPYVYEFIKAFWGPSKKEMTFKCRAKFCNKEIKYTSVSFYNLKTHYEKQHPHECPDFLAALTAGYAYKKRSRNASGARYVLKCILIF